MALTLTFEIVKKKTMWETDVLGRRCLLTISTGPRGTYKTHKYPQINWLGYTVVLVVDIQ